MLELDVSKFLLVHIFFFLVAVYKFWCISWWCSRYSLGANKSDVGELSFFSGASGNNNRGFTIDSPTDSSWHSMGSSLPPYQLSKPRDLQGGFSYSHFEPSQELGQVTIASLSHSQEQDRRSFGGGGGGGAGLMGNVKQENQPLRPFFDEWPGRRDSWSEMEDERSNGTSFSTTQLSISIPMPRCDWSNRHKRQVQGHLPAPWCCRDSFSHCICAMNSEQDPYVLLLAETEEPCSYFQDSTLRFTLALGQVCVLLR